MYALKPIEPNTLTVADTQQDFPFDAKLFSDIQNLNPKVTYSKTRLAQMWGINRNTIRRWVKVATAANTPGFNRAFNRVLRVANCPECGEVRLTDLQFLHLQRNWLVECPNCGTSFKATPRLKEVISLDMKLPGRYAQVLRIVGYLISVHGTERTKRILSISQLPQDKQIRQSIRKILLSGI